MGGGGDVVLRVQRATCAHPNFSPIPEQRHLIGGGHSLLLISRGPEPTGPRGRVAFWGLDSLGCSARDLLVAKS